MVVFMANIVQIKAKIDALILDEFGPQVSALVTDADKNALIKKLVEIKVLDSLINFSNRHFQP